MLLRLLLLSAALMVATTTGRSVDTNAVTGNAGPSSAGSSCCPSGWFAFDGRCHWFTRSYEQMRPFQSARGKCEQMGGTLFVPRTYEEWTAVISQTVLLHVPSWVGLSMNPIKQNYAGFEWDETNDGAETLDPEVLNWYVKTTPHGYVHGAECAAHLHNYFARSSYVHFYPCAHRQHFVCTRPERATEPVEDEEPGACCPNGWMAKGGACVWYARYLDQMTTYNRAEAQCEESGATLYAAKSVDEWAAVTGETSLVHNNWIGLAMHPNDQHNPGLQWQHDDGDRAMDTDDLPWLVKTPTHGHNAVSNCVVFHNDPLGYRHGTWTHFFNCKVNAMYACKKDGM